MALLQEGDLAGQRRPAHLNAAMLAIGGLGRRERQGGVVEEQLHVFKQRALIALERQHIGAALIGDRSSDLALTGHGVGRDHHAGEAEHLEQLRDRGDLVGLVAHPATCPSTRRCSAAQAETRCSGEAPAARSKERRRVLPSSATTPGQPSAKWRMNARKQAWNCSGSSNRNTRENVSWLGMPCSRGRNWRRNGSLA